METHKPKLGHTLQSATQKEVFNHLYEKLWVVKGGHMIFITHFWTRPRARQDTSLMLLSLVVGSDQIKVYIAKVKRGGVARFSLLFSVTLSRC